MVGWSVPAQPQRGQDDDHEHQEEEALVHGKLIFTRPGKRGDKSRTLNFSKAKKMADTGLTLHQGATPSPGKPHKFDLCIYWGLTKPLPGQGTSP